MIGKNLLTITPAIGLAGFLTLSVMIGSGFARNEPVEPDMTPALQTGRAHYEQFCSVCHGTTARGTDRGPTFIDPIYHPGHHGDRAFMIAPRQGVKAHHWSFGDMPPIEGVSDEQLLDILMYIRAVQRANGLY